MTTKSLLKFKNSRFLTHNIWPTRKINMKQKEILLKLRKKKLSNFGVQFFAKRFLSILYGNLSAKDFTLSISEAKKLKGKIGFNFLIFLERRLDTILFRMNICQTFRQARQLIIHKKIFINNKCISKPSYQLKNGDILNISPTSDKKFSQIALSCRKLIKDPNQDSSHRQSLPPFGNLCKTKPLHLEINLKTLSCILLYPPQQIIFPSKFELPKIN